MRVRAPYYPHHRHKVVTACQHPEQIRTWCETYWQDRMQEDPVRIMLTAINGEAYYVLYVRDYSDYVYCRLIWS